MNDIQKSELVVAKILQLLIEWGIQETELEFAELNLEDEFAPFFFPCIDWLTHEGIIRTEKVIRYTDGKANGVVMRPVLTALGLSVLGKAIQVGNNKVMLAEAVNSVSEQKTTYSGLGDFVGGILGGFTKSIGS